MIISDTKIYKIIQQNYQILIAISIFIAIVFFHVPFHTSIILMLEFTVVLEVVKMIGDFIEKRKIRLRFAIDIFIIFLIRDVSILATKMDKDYENIVFLLAIISVFFIFRVVALQYSPSSYDKEKS